jgi:hypothetical protein
LFGNGNRIWKQFPPNEWIGVYAAQGRWLSRRLPADFTHSISPDVVAISDLDLGNKSVTNDIEKVLRKIEYWHQGSFAAFKIVYRDSLGIWDGVLQWDGGRASFFCPSRNRRGFSPEKTFRPAGEPSMKKSNSLLIGYAGISKADAQDTVVQVKALTQAGCKPIFEEKASGGRWDRPELHKALEQLREGDVLVVWKLTGFRDRLKICSISWNPCARPAPVFGASPRPWTPRRPHVDADVGEFRRIRAVNGP